MIVEREREREFGFLVFEIRLAVSCCAAYQSLLAEAVSDRLVRPDTATLAPLRFAGRAYTFSFLGPTFLGYYCNTPCYGQTQVYLFYVGGVLG